MANKYEKIDPETKALVEEVMTEHHEELVAIGITVDVLFGYAPRNDDGELTGPALKVHGYPANGIASVVNLKNRVKGNADAEIIIDGDTWPKLSIGQRRALLDHELEHFVVARNVDGEVIRDTHGRPKLKLRQHDWNFGFFNSIAMRHGENSPEIQHMRAFVDTAKEIYFGFMVEVPVKPALKAPSKKKEPKKAVPQKNPAK